MNTWSRDQATVASLIVEEDRVLFQFRDAVWLGRSQSVRASAKSPRNAATAFQLKRDPRNEIVFWGLGTKSRRRVSLRVRRGLGLVPIQLLAPRWKPGVGSGEVLSSATPICDMRV